VNLLGVVNGIAAAYPLMLEQGHGHIVNTASMAGLVPSPGFGPYASTKSAIVGLSLALRLEAAERGVRVSVVCPGVVDTPMLDRKHPDGLPLTPSQAKTDVRAFSTHMGGSPYPPERLANDVLRGVEANRAVIVAPAAARVVWRLYRFVPGAVSVLGRRTFERERRLWGWTPT
jgi:short-subunit dehydrogenase